MAQVSRKKQVVSLYINVELWEEFKLACEARETTRGRLVAKYIQRQMAEWGEESPVTPLAPHAQNGGV
jgi:hypothetical protein